MSQRNPIPFRLITAFACVLFAAAPLAATADDAEVAPTPATPSKITAATVYTDRAIVTRTARATLQAGESNVVLEKFPADLIDASVQVRGKGAAAATILGVITAVIHAAQVDAATQPRVRALQDEIKIIDKTLRELNDRDAVLQWQVRLVEKIENAVAAPPSKDAPASHPGIDDMQKLMAFSRENRDTLATDRRKLADEIDETKNKRAALQSQLNEILRGGSARKSHKTVTVRLSATKAGPLDLTIDYTVPNAGWTPAYDVRLRAEQREVELAYFGIVRQSSGEDWNDIALTLSTARPGLGGGAPETRPWYVDVYAPKPVQTVVTSGAPAGANYEGSLQFKQMDMDAAKVCLSLGAAGGYNAYSANGGLLNGVAGKFDFAGSPPPPAIASAYATAKVNSATTSASFKIAAATSIPSDYSPRKVSITTARLAAKLEYQAVPALQETAFLDASVENATDYPLLAGSTNVFLDDAFVATSTIKTIMPSERFQLALGADEGVAIKRRVVNRFSETTGLTGKGRRVTYEYLVTITNNKKTAERVVFKESLPISRNEKIVLNMLAPAERDIGTPEKNGREVTREENNTLVWRIDLKPGEKREIPVKFNLEHPGDIQVTGLE